MHPSTSARAPVNEPSTSQPTPRVLIPAFPFCKERWGFSRKITTTKAYPPFKTNEPFAFLRKRPVTPEGGRSADGTLLPLAPFNLDFEGYTDVAEEDRFHNQS
ncbi:hypothetical protein I302_108702 [Kwoniella bestiolae CBS 10118]|uniref:Uncharacterized protein n=1 Tax=Kwoniella bestiolae CBS 10118 TaxID=1296100 RepID=A0A1B9FTV2_9TREE|nr:hypothetical protein I302_07838 [Kwoniella bestiolae CBS 10118]OCF22193.1 hypothetical protein I302_07838 [Kwoniella bestiolae CBS 10118]